MCLTVSQDYLNQNHIRKLSKSVNVRFNPAAFRVKASVTFAQTTMFFPLNTGRETPEGFRLKTTRIPARDGKGIQSKASGA
jgi:hypothetical protein